MAIGRALLWSATVVWLAGVTGCRSRGEAPTGPEPYLAVWAGDADRQQSDFLTIVDVDPGSRSYGKVVKTYPVRSTGNEPHRLQSSWRMDGKLFAGGLLTNRVFVFDLREPEKGSLQKTVDAGGSRRYWTPHHLVSLPDGRVVATCPDRARYRGDGREVLGTPGGLLELDASGRVVRELPADDAKAVTLIVAPTGAAVVPGARRLITTNRGHGFAATTQGEMMPGMSVQLWSLRDLRVEQTVVLAAGPRGEENLGPEAVAVLRRKPVAFVSTHEGGALYVSDSVGGDATAFRLAHDFGAGSLPADSAVTPDDRWLVQVLTGRNGLMVLDVSDPVRPRVASTLRIGDEVVAAGRRHVRGGPSGLAMSADG